MKDNRMTLSRISIVTPSFNQGAFLEACIDSVLSQNYPDLEYIIIDGGSTDDSVDIIRKYERHLAYWVSKPDAGQYQAIAKGFSLSTGEVMAWLNSDDIYLPGALQAVGEIFRNFPDVAWLTTRFPTGLNEKGALIKLGCFAGFSRHHFLRGDYLPECGWEANGFIQQESTFWRRSLWTRSGSGFGGDLKYAGDFELWCRFFQHARLYGVDVPLGCFRRHELQKTDVSFQGYLDEAKSVFINAGGKVLPATLQRFRMRILETCVTSAWLRRRASRFGLLKGAENITYDWDRSSWVKEW